MSDIQNILSRISSDEQFRSALLANPSEALQQMGIQASAEMLVAFNGVDGEDLNTNQKICC